jgi:integrase
VIGRRIVAGRKNEYVTNTFVRRRDAEEWALDVERSIDRGTQIRRSRPSEQHRIFSDLIALRLDDLAQVGKPVRRSKSMVLKALKTSLRGVNLKDITRERLIEFGRKRAADGAAFHRTCKAIDIDDLCFHDLRHEGTSRLFEAGFSIQQVAMVTGHKDWRMLRRYTNLKPEDLHKMQKAAQLSKEQFLATLAAS